MPKKPEYFLRALILVFSLCGLLIVFLFQHANLASALSGGLSATNKFLINRTARYLANDFLMIALIYALFWSKKYVLFALYVQVAGIVLFLIPYFVLKINFPWYSGPLISFLHRLIINPLLLALLIPAFFYQEKSKVSGKS